MHQASEMCGQRKGASYLLPECMELWGQRFKLSVFRVLALSPFASPLLTVGAEVFASLVVRAGLRPRDAYSGDGPRDAAAPCHVDGPDCTLLSL